MIWHVFVFLFAAWAIMGTIWICFLAVMKAKQHLAELRWFHLMWVYPFAAVFILLDAAFRLTFGTVMFLELPHKGTILFTGLCKHHKAEDSWRGRLARFWCANFLNPFDPSGRHC